MLNEICRVSDGINDDFVGLRFTDDKAQNGFKKPEIIFPRGYRLSSEENNLRKDVLHLFLILHKFTNINQGRTQNNIETEKVSFPILSYQYIIYDFLANGYYADKDVEYKKSQSGKINWQRTIQKVKPMVDNCNIIYLDYITKKTINKSDVITKIHEYCVYESFSKLGWLYLKSAYTPRKPSLTINKNNEKRFIAIINDAFKNTFNNNKKMLFKNMIAIIKQANENSNFQNELYGVNKFEYIWERLVDYTYGIDNKEEYFPHGSYDLLLDKGIREQINSALEPDTIMKSNGKVFVLDSKYYKYGITLRAESLPPTSSIHKQIIYGKYISKKMCSNKDSVFNAFILPYNSKSSDVFYKFVGVGKGDWIIYDAGTPNYNYVAVILLDTKYLMDNYTRKNAREIDYMDKFIVDSIKYYRDLAERSK